MPYNAGPSVLTNQNKTVCKGVPKEKDLVSITVVATTNIAKGDHEISVDTVSLDTISVDTVSVDTVSVYTNSVETMRNKIQVGSYQQLTKKRKRAR